MTSELVRRPSCWDSETDQRELGEFISKWFTHHGIQAENDEVGNVLVNPNAPVILNGHLDVVAPAGEANYEPKLIGDKIVGRGTSDMKGALAVMMQIVKDLHGKYELGLVFDVTEEAEFAKCGADILCERRVFDNTKFLIVGEPSVDVPEGKTHLIVGAEGAFDCTLNISTDETTYHAGNLHLANNAIVITAQYVNSLLQNGDVTVPLDTFKKSYRPWQVPIGKGPINFGKIMGGTQPTLTANHCELQLEKRLFPEENCEDFADKLEKYSMDFAKRNKAKIEIQMTWHANPFLMKSSSPAFDFVHRWALKNGLEISFLNGVSDLNKICDHIRKTKKRNLPSVNLGPGNWPVIHTRHEFINVSDLHKFYKLYTNLIEEVSLGEGKFLVA